MSLKRATALALGRLRLQRAALRMLEWSRTRHAFRELLSPRRRQGADGLALPPPILRVQVTGTARAEEFLAQGRRTEETLRVAIRGTGTELEDFGSILDFGCGCGRVMRRWARVSGPSFFGSDYNPRLIHWCRQNLPFAHFEVNGLEPPLPFADAQFDLVYALSVFTHLTEVLQRQWMSELRRVTVPNGLLLITTRGEAWTWKLSPEERRRYENGNLVVRYGEVEGTNLCSAFHPWEYVSNTLAAELHIKESRSAALQDGSQDVHVLQLPA